MPVTSAATVDAAIGDERAESDRGAAGRGRRGDRDARLVGDGLGLATLVVGVDDALRFAADRVDQPARSLWKLPTSGAPSIARRVLPLALATACS